MKNCEAATATPIMLCALLFLLVSTELSEVLWTMVFGRAISMGVGNPGLGAIAVFVIFSFWAGESEWLIVVRSLCNIAGLVEGHRSPIQIGLSTAILVPEHFKHS